MKHIIFLVLILSSNIAFAQIQSNCTNNAALISNAYKADINLLAINRLYEIQHADTAQIIVPQIHTDSILKAFVAVFNLSTQLDADSVFSKHCIHDYYSNVNSVMVRIDTTQAWTSAWQNLQTTTTNAQANYYTSTFGLTVTNYYKWPFGQYVVLQSSMQLNLHALCDSLNAIGGLAQCEINTVIGDGNRIFYTTTTAGQQLDFWLQWGDCPAGCTVAKPWKYTIDNGCSLTMSVTLPMFGPAPPAPINCNLGPNRIATIYKPNIQIYPNPTSSTVNITSQEKGTLTLLDVTGAVLKTVAVNKGENQLDISAQANGIYFIQFKTEKGIAVQRILKE